MTFIPVFLLIAQDERTSRHNNLKLAVEFGTNYASTGLVKPEQIRENHSQGHFSGDYYYDFGHFGEYTDVKTTYFGIKPELFFLKNRIGIASGLRFSIARSYLISDRDVFLWRVKEEGLNTEYVRINEIQHQSYLVGIPLEIRHFINRRELPIQTYFKIGASFNYRIQAKNMIHFTNKAMEKYDEIVQNQLPNGNDFSVFFFGAVGFKIGRYKEGRWNPWGNIEFQFPHFLLTNDAFPFAEQINDINFPGGGFQVSFQIPIGKNVPIGSN